MNPQGTALFKKISGEYERVHGRVIGALYQVARAHFYGRCRGHSVLDVGNGGQTPARLFGEDGLPGVFVGLDDSPEMLQRPGATHLRVTGTGLSLPFRDRSFDYVLINGVFHHLGFESTEPHVERVLHFIQEARRVCRREVLVYELFTPLFFERIQRLAVSLLGDMHAFVLTESTFDRILGSAGLQREQITRRTLSELTHPFYCYPVLSEHSWLRIPAFLNPFHHVFFVIPAGT